MANCRRSFFLFFLSGLIVLLFGCSDFEGMGQEPFGGDTDYTENGAYGQGDFQVEQQAVQQVTQKMPSQNIRQSELQHGNRHYQEPVYRAFAFDYPGSYQVINAGLSQGSVLLPYALLGNADRSTFLFVNNASMFNYVHFSHVNMPPGAFYAGAYVTDNISYPVHLEHVMKRNGIPSYRVEKQDTVYEQNQEQGRFRLAFQGQDGRQYRGTVYVTLTPAQGGPFVMPVDWGFFSSGDLGQAERDLTVMMQSLSVDRAVAQRLDQQRAQEINHMRMADRRNNQALARSGSSGGYASSGSLTDESVKSSRRMADLIGGSTSRHNPHTGETERLNETYDNHYFADPSGNIITNNTGISPGADFREMHRVED